MTWHPRYDEVRAVFRGCHFCGGRGCLACPGEATRAYERERPHLLATFRWENPADMATLHAAMHVEQVRAAFRPGGGGVRAIEHRLWQSYMQRLCGAVRARIHALGGDSCPS